MITLTAPITRVALAEDRAFVTREATVTLSSGQVLVVCPEVSPLLADKSLVLEAAGVVTVREVRVVRERKENVSVPPEELEALEQELATLQDRLRAHQREQAEMEEVARQVLREIAEDVAWGRGESERWAGALEQLHTREDELAERETRLRDEVEAAEERLESRRLREGPESEEKVRLLARVEALLECSGETETRLSLSYCVPCACWRPRHQAELRDGRLTFTSFAGVWQKTLEDWEGVDVRLSTERTAQTTALPSLTPDHLKLKDRESEVVLAAREETISELAPSETRLVQELPGIDDGGEAYVLEASGKLDLKADGKPTQVELFTFTTGAEMERLARPERARQVFFRSTQCNEHDRPLLPGPVELIREGRLVGRTWLDFTPPGGEFELVWGADSGITVHRTCESKEDEEKLMRGWVKTHRRVTLYLSNLEDQAKKVKVTERIPVSEIEDLKVQLNRTETFEGAEPDKNGFIRWEFVLEPGQRKRLPLAYTMDRKKSATFG